MPVAKRRTKQTSAKTLVTKDRAARIKKSGQAKTALTTARKKETAAQKSPMPRTIAKKKVAKSNLGRLAKLARQ